MDYEALVMALPVAAGLLDAGRVARANAAMARLFQAPPERLEGRSIWDFVAGGGAEELQQRYAARLRGEAVTTRYEMELVRPDGSHFEVESDAQALDGRRTLVIFRELAHNRHLTLASRLSEAAAEVQRARTPEAVITAACAALLKVGLRAYVSRVTPAGLELVGSSPDDPLFAAAELLLLGRSTAGEGARSPRPTPLPNIPAQARFVDDFPATTRAYLKSAGIDPGSMAAALALPEYGRAIGAPLQVEGQVWGTLTATGERLQAVDVGALALFAAQVGSSLEVALSLQSLRQTNAQLASVHAVAAAGAESELGKLVPRLLGIVARSTDADCAALWREEAGDLVLTGAVQPDFAVPAPQRLPMGGGTLVSQIIERGAPRAFPLDPLPWPGLAASAAAGLKHLALFPLQLDGKRVGVLNLGRFRDQPFGASELQGGKVLADQVVIQIEKAVLIESERRRVHDLQLLLDVGRLITASLDPDEILESAAANLARMVDATDAFIWLLDPATGELRGAATSTPEFREHFRAARTTPGAEPNLAGHVMNTRAVVRVADTSRSELLSARLNAVYRVKSLLGMPLMIRDQPVGAVTIGDRHRPRDWTDAEVERAMLVVRQVSVAVANARLFDDLKRSYDKLAQAREELVKRERLAALGELSAVVAHEVRNPLGVVFNSLGSLRKAVRGNADAEMLLGIVGEEADRLNRIVSDLLDFARPHEASLRLEPVDAVLSSAREATLALTGSALDIALELAPDLPRVAVDARMLRQALINLLVNAVQASPRGARVALRGWRDGDTVRLDVADSGPGIPAAHRHRIFQPFFTTKATGTGLGLAVVKRIVDAHAGEVLVETGEGRGTTFSVKLPVPGE